MGGTIPSVGDVGEQWDNGIWRLLNNFENDEAALKYLVRRSMRKLKKEILKDNDYKLNMVFTGSVLLSTLTYIYEQTRIFLISNAQQKKMQNDD